MAEPRKIAFETVKPSSKDKKQKRSTPSHRFSLTLLESDHKTYSEYSYHDLLKSISKNDTNAENGDKDPFGDSNDDTDAIRAMAKKFEEKYGPKPAKKKKHQKWEEYIDKGLGYDETDPFIDNDEAYDELVPSSITTQHGGFYINLGELEFRAVSSEDEPFPYNPNKKRKKKKKLKDLIQKERRKKRVIRDDDDEDEEEEVTAPVVKKNKKLGELSHDDLNRDPVNKKVKLTPVSEPKETNNTSVNNHLSPVSGNNVTPPSTDNDFETAPPVKEPDPPDDSSTSSDSEEPEPKVAVIPGEIPKLPENLPTDLESCIDNLKQAALMSEEGKCKFFTNDINDILLNVELKSRELTTGNRSMVYSHLASHLPCTKETLLKRAKKLRMDQEGSKLYQPMEKLKNAVVEAMPAQKSRYALECEAAAAIEKADREKEAENKSEKESEEKKPSRGPRRKFAWTPELRALLCDVVKVKLKCFEVMKARTQTVEEYLQRFLEMEIKDMWPPGWMNSRILMRESKTVYAHLSKVKKPAVPAKKVVQMASVVVSAVPASTVTITTPPVSILKTDPSPLEAANSILSTMKNASLTKISETASLPSISKLIQQTKVSSFQAATPTSVIETISKASIAESIVAKATNVHSASLLAQNKANTMSIENVPGKRDLALTGFAANNCDVSPGMEAKVVATSTPVHTPTAPKQSYKEKIEQLTKANLMKSPESHMNVPMSSANVSPATVHAVKEQLSAKESSAIDVLDQIINASLGNFKSPVSDAFGNVSSKLVENALVGLTNQSKSPAQNMSSATSMSQQHPTSAMSIVKAAAAAAANSNKSPVSGHAMPTGLLDTTKSVLQTQPENIYKSFEKYLTDNTQGQALSVTPVSKGRTNVSPAHVSPHSTFAKHQIDPNAPYRSSYGFHEAFLNSLNPNSTEQMHQNVHKSPPKATVPAKLPEIAMSSPSGYMKKQDFYSPNKAMAMMPQNARNKMPENLPKSNAYVTMPSPQSHGSYPQMSLHSQITNAAESLDNIVNLAIAEKPRKSPNVAAHRQNKSVIQSPNDFIQDGLASSLLHHASFANVPKTTSSPKSEHYNVNKYHGHAKHDMEMSRTTTPSPHGWSAIKKPDNSYSTSPVMSKSSMSPSMNSDVIAVAAAGFRHPSPTAGGVPKSKSPGSNHMSPPYAKYQTSHHIKPYSHISQSQSAMQQQQQNQMLMQQQQQQQHQQVIQASAYQTPTSPSMSPSSQHHHVNMISPTSPVYGHIQNFNQVQHQQQQHHHQQQQQQSPHGHLH